MNKLRVGIVGGGHLGQIHLRLLGEHDHVERVLLVETNESTRQEIESTHGVATSGKLQDLLQADLDAVIVATPTHSHHAVACELLRNGLHVFVEKPLALDVAQAQDILSEALFADRVLQVGHVERFNPAFVAARPCIDSPRYIEAVRTSNYSMRSTDIGVVLDLMIHDIDLVLNLVGEPVVHVDATGSTVVGPYEDQAEARLVFEGGCVAQLKASRVSRQRQRSMTVRTADETFLLDFDGPTATVEKRAPQLRSLAGSLPNLAAADRKRLADQFFDCYLPQQEIATRPANAILNEQRDFFSAILREGTPKVSGHAGAGAVAIAEQVMRRIAEFEEAVRPAPLPFHGPHWQRSGSRRRAS